MAPPNPHPAVRARSGPRFRPGHGSALAGDGGTVALEQGPPVALESGPPVALEPGSHFAVEAGSAGSAGVSAVLNVLEALDRRGPTTLSELARETGVAKSTLHRVCTTMGRRGWVARDPYSGQLELGPRVAWLARATPASALTPAFRTVAARLVRRHNETACLTVLDGRDSVFVAKEETSHPVRLVTAVGSRLPAFASASGRAMLADLCKAEVDAMYAGCELTTPTGRRLKGLQELHAILNETRRRGYGENIDDTALGLHCVAAPLGPPGRVSAAITLCVPSGRMNPARKRELVADLLAAAAELVEGSSPLLHRKVCK